MHSTHDLELFPGQAVTQLLFRDVKNCAELRKMAVEGQIVGALINPTMVKKKTITFSPQSLFHSEKLTIDFSFQTLLQSPLTRFQLSVFVIISIKLFFLKKH